MPTAMYYDLPMAADLKATSRIREILRIAVALNAGRSASELVDALFEHLEGLVPYDRIGLALLEPGGFLRQHYVRSKLPIRWGVGAQARLKGTSLEPIVREGKIRIIGDLAAHLAEHPTSQTAAFLLSEGMRASLTLPLTTCETTVGALFFSSREPHVYVPAHVEFVATLAQAIAAAIERARLTEGLAAAKDALEAFDALKSTYLNTLSHELKTPLTMIRANAEMLAEEAVSTLTPAQRGYLDEVLAGTERLSRVFETLADYTAIEHGQLRVHKVPVEVGALVRELAAELSPALADAGLELSVQIKDEPLNILADPPRIAQIVRALVDNARKFTPPPGLVQLSASCTDQMVAISVQDSGIGIAPQHQERVFDSFFQVESGLDRTYGGSGLGLAVARAIVLAHGGFITLRSAPGLGSVFSVYLPLAEPRDEPAPNRAGS